MLPACRRPYIRCAYILPLAFLAFGLLLGVINLLSAPHYETAGGPSGPGVDVCIGGKRVENVEVESVEVAAWWASRSPHLRFAGYALAALSVLWLVRNMRKPDVDRKSSELQVISKYFLE